MPLALEVHPTRPDAERSVASEIVALVRAKPDLVLGIATGDSPLGVYRELVLARERGVDFTYVRAFNLDEYAGLPVGDARSFRAYALRELATRVGLRPANVHVPVTLGPRESLVLECDAYERAIRAAGGIDLQLLGIGRNGHVGFNEPGSERVARTRLVELHEWTREDAAQGFGGLARVPLAGVTVGVATILEARAIRALAFGAKKALVVRRTLAERSSSEWPASFLHEHPNAKLVVDLAAAG